MRSPPGNASYSIEIKNTTSTKRSDEERSERQACKPDSVSRHPPRFVAERKDGHSSWPQNYSRGSCDLPTLPQPVRSDGTGPSLPRQFCFAELPGGASRIYLVLLRGEIARFTPRLPYLSMEEAGTRLCGSDPPLTRDGCYPLRLPCGVRTFLPPTPLASDHPACLSRRPLYRKSPEGGLGLTLQPLGHRLVGQPIRLFILRPRDVLNCESLKTFHEIANQDMQPLKLPIPDPIRP